MVFLISTEEDWGLCKTRSSWSVSSSTFVSEDKPSNFVYYVKKYFNFQKQIQKQIFVFFVFRFVYYVKKSPINFYDLSWC